MAADTTTSRAPDGRFLLSHPAHFVALGFGCGLLPLGPGTWGTFATIPLYWALAQVLSPFSIAFLAIPLFVVGVWACEITGRDLGVSDHRSMCWDEIVAFLPLAAVAASMAPLNGDPRNVWLQVALAVVFRVFDIWKPYPIRELERRVKGGLGVMLDDVVAAGYAYVVFFVAILVAHKGFGWQ